MKSNLKIVAAAVLLAAGATAASAATVAVNPAATVYSKEALLLKGGNIALPNVVVTLGNNYTYQDDLKITFTGATLVNGTPTATCAGGLPTVLGFVERVGNTLNFRITNQEGATTGTICTFSGLQAESLSIANSSGVSVNYQGVRFITGQIIDSGSLAAAGISVVTQFKATVQQAFNATVDVQANRLKFALPNTGAGDGDLSDSLAFTFDYYSGSNDNPANYFPANEFVNATATTFTIDGDFSFAGATDAACRTYFGGAAVTLAGLTLDAAASSCSKLVLKDAAGFGPPPEAYQVRVDVPGNKTLNPTDFSGTALVAYTLNSDNSKTSSVVLGWDPGAWGINGTIVRIAYMPYGENISQIIWIANKGQLDGDITMDYFTDTGVNGSGVKLTTMARKRSVTALAGEIKEKLAGAGFTAGKAHITLIVPVTDRDIEVYSAYNVGGNDRGNVVNNSNGRSFFFGTGCDGLNCVNFN